MVTVKNLTKNKTLLLGISAVVSLAACGGFVYTTVGGNVEALTKGSSLVLQNEGNYTVTMTESGPFSFKVASNAAYTISVGTQPNTDNCTVLNGKGQMTGDTPVTNVVVKCVPNVQISGTLTGLAVTNSIELGTQSGLTDATTTLISQGPFLANGEIKLPYYIVSDYKYVVSVVTQPAAQDCTVLGGTGTADNTKTTGVTPFAVTCVPAVTIGGTVTGLKAGLIVGLSNAAVINGVPSSYPLAIATPTTAATAYKFNKSLIDGSAYNVTVSTQPVGQTCTVTKGSGVAKLSTPAPNPAANIVVNCI